MPISSNILLGGRLSSYPSYYPINIRIFFKSQTEADNFVLKRQLGIDKEAEHYSKKYDIASFIALCQYSPIDILDWLGLREDPFVKNYGLPDVIRRALSFEISNIARDQESKRREQERKLEMKEMEYNSQLKFGNPNSTFGKVYS